MADAKQIKDQLTLEDIQKLMEELEAEPKLANDILISKTVCHGGHKHKLFYYDNKKTFVCFTGNCGTMDVFSLVQKIEDCSFIEAIKFVSKFFGIKSQGGGDYVNYRLTNPYQKFLKKLDPTQVEDDEPIKPISKKYLNYFYNFAPIQWIEEGISQLTMAKFNVRYDVSEQRIVIPHFDEKGELVGIRCRNLLPEFVNNGIKYVPLLYNGKQFNHPTGKVLYGLKENRKGILANKKCLLFEAEKSVMKLDSMLGNNNFSVALSGSNLTNYQIKLLKQLDINEVIIGLDKEYEEPFTKKEQIYAEKIESEFERLLPFFKVSVLWDKGKLLNYKDSPVDQGKKTFEFLMKDRIILE